MKVFKIYIAKYKFIVCIIIIIILEDLVISEEELLEHLERLIHLYRDSPWGNFAYGLILWWKGNTYDAKQHLKKGLFSSTHFILVLLYTNIKLSEELKLCSGK